MAVKVLTMREAARRLRRSRPQVSNLLVAGKLTAATINDRPAVADDATFRRVARAVQQEAA
jgi:hypothetical protein